MVQCSGCVCVRHNPLLHPATIMRSPGLNSRATRMSCPSGDGPTVLDSSICSLQNWPSVCGSSPSNVSMAGPKRYVRFLKDGMNHTTGKTFQILRFLTKKKKKEKLQRDLRESQRWVKHFHAEPARISVGGINPPYII